MALLAIASTPCSEPGIADTTSVFRTARLDASAHVQLGYLLYLPNEYEESGSWPLLLFLHGYGARGDDLELVKAHGPPKLIAEGKDFPFVIVSPQDPRGWWEPMELTVLLDKVVSEYKIDQSRIYVTGLSLGGFGTWELAHFAPDRFAAIAPICGGGEVYWADEIAHLPIWAFHGAKDSVVPVSRTTDLVDAIREHGGKPKLTIYPEAGHDSWTMTYNNPALYDWLLKHKKEDPE